MLKKLFIWPLIFVLQLRLVTAVEISNPEVKAEVKDLERSILFYASKETLREKLAKILLHLLRTDMMANLEGRLSSMNDPSQPLATEFMLSDAIFAQLLRKNQATLAAAIAPHLQNPAEAGELLEKYAKILDGFESGVEGELRIAPHFQWAKLDIDKPNPRNEALLAKIPRSDEHRVISRLDFDLRADPVVDFSRLKFFTRDGSSGQKKEIPSLNLDLSNVKLGEPSWFYIVAALEQIFQRKEYHAVLKDFRIETSGEGEGALKGAFQSSLTPAAAARSLAADRTADEFEFHIANQTPVLIFHRKTISGDWEEKWVWKTDDHLHEIAELRKKGRVGYLIEANVDFEKREGPFHFQEAWFGSNLAPNYLDIDTVDKITAQVFTPEKFDLAVKTLLDSPTIQQVIREIDNDLNEKVLPKLQKELVMVGVLAVELPNGEVKSHYFTDMKEFETGFKALRTEGNLVYAAKLKVPLAVQDIHFKIDRPLVLSAALDLQKQILVQAELYYLDSQKFNFKTLGLENSSLRVLFERMSRMDLSGSPLRVEGQIQLSNQLAALRLPIVWRSYGPDVDESKMELSLKPLEGSSLQITKIQWPGVEAEGLGIHSLGTDLECMMNSPSARDCTRSTLNNISVAASAMASAELQSWVSGMTNAQSPGRFFSIESKKKGAEVSAKFGVSSLPISTDSIRCQLVDGESVPSPASYEKLSPQLKVLAAEPALIRWQCQVKLPPTMKLEIRDLKTPTGDISQAQGTFARKSDRPYSFFVKLVRSPEGESLFVVPENLDPAQIFDEYELKVEVPLSADIVGKDRVARAARAVKGIALSLGASNGGLAQVLGVKTFVAISDAERKNAEKGLMDGWRDNRQAAAEELLQQSFVQVPDHLFSQKIPLFPVTDQVKGQEDGKAVTVGFVESQAKKRIAELAHETIQETPFEDASKKNQKPSFLDLRTMNRRELARRYISPEPWKKAFKQLLYQVPFSYQPEIEHELFSTVQAEAMDVLTDNANDMFKNDLTRNIQGIASSLLLKNRQFELPRIESVCLAKSPYSGLQEKEIYSVLMTAQTNLPPVVKIDPERLPRDFAQREKDGHFSVALGREYLNEAIRTNEEQIRVLLEETLKYDEDPVTGKKKKRAGVSEKNFRLEYVHPRLEMQNNEAVLVIDARVSQPFKFWGRWLPIAGHVMDALMSPILSVDTKNVRITISPERESISFLDREGKEQAIAFSSKTSGSRKIELQKSVFRSVLSRVVIAAMKKKLMEKDIVIPMNTSFENNDVVYSFKDLRVDQNWFVVEVEPKLGPEIEKPFSVQFDFESKVPADQAKAAEAARKLAESKKNPETALSTVPQ